MEELIKVENRTLVFEEPSMSPTGDGNFVYGRLRLFYNEEATQTPMKKCHFKIKVSKSPECMKYCRVNPRKGFLEKKGDSKDVEIYALSKAFRKSGGIINFQVQVFFEPENGEVEGDPEKSFYINIKGTYQKRKNDSTRIFNSTPDPASPLLDCQLGEDKEEQLKVVVTELKAEISELKKTISLLEGQFREMVLGMEETKKSLENIRKGAELTNRETGKEKCTKTSEESWEFTVNLKKVK